MVDRKYLDVPITFGAEDKHQVGWFHITRLVAHILEQPGAFKLASTFQLIDGEMQLCEISIVRASDPESEGTPIARTYMD